MTSFWAVSLYAVLSGLSGLSIGRWLLPSDRALDRAWEDGRRRGQREADRSAWSAGYEQGAYEYGRGLYEMRDDDERPGADHGARDGDVRRLDDGVERGTACNGDLPDIPEDRGRAASGLQDLAADDRGPSGLDPRAAGGVDWADELGGIRTQIAVDDATEVLAAQPDPPTPGSFEYYLSDWQSRFDHWLAGEMAELAATRRKLGIS